MDTRTWQEGLGVYRRRRCEDCFSRFSTIEASPLAWVSKEEALREKAQRLEEVIETIRAELKLDQDKVSQELQIQQLIKEQAKDERRTQLKYGYSPDAGRRGKPDWEYRDFEEQ